MRSQAIRKPWSPVVGNLVGDMGVAFCDDTETVIGGGGGSLPFTNRTFATTIASVPVHKGQALGSGMTAPSSGWYYDCNGSNATTGGQAYAFAICLKAH